MTRNRRPSNSAREPSLAALEKTLRVSLAGAGEILRQFFGKVLNPRAKAADQSIVCDADLASERFVIGQIEEAFPSHNIISEECGRCWKGSEYTWILDPLDGTSNFVAGLPWFGVQAAVLRKGRAIMAAMYLPQEKQFYFAVRGGGASKNGRPCRVTGERQLRNALCAFGFDPVPFKRTRSMIELLFRISAGIRNTRATNSLVDFCYTIDGRLGACVNMKTKVWDIAPVSLILPEADGKFSDLEGAPIVFQLDEGVAEREYAIMGASRVLHRQLFRLLRE